MKELNGVYESKPVEEMRINPDLSGKDQPDLIDMVIRLSQTVARQQDEINSLRGDLRALSETATNTDYKAGQALTTSADVKDNIEMLTDDIVMLDERTQPLVYGGCGCRISKDPTSVSDVGKKFRESLGKTFFSGEL